MNIGIIIAIIIGVCLYLNLFRMIVSCIKNKHYLGLIYALMSLPFLIFMSSSMMLGGSAFNDVATEYELYQPGRYYLVSHGSYTEVTKIQYLYMQIIEIIGISTFFISFALALILNLTERKTSTDNMKTVKKIYSRAFQTVMRLLIPLFPYREPKLLDGIEEVAALLKKEGKERVMLVTDKGIHSLGLTKPLEDLLDKNGIACAVYNKTLPNPTSENVEEARELYIASGAQALIAFGGGSPMDCAKAVGARLVRPKMPLSKMQGLIKICKALPLLIAVPTTAGTGSETTVASVIVDSATHHKYIINDFYLIPGYAVLNPEVTLGLPKYLTATTGMDALTHAIEVYVGRSRTKETKAAAEKAVKLIFENLERAYCDGGDLEARRNMLKASYLAGTAFTKSYVGYVHAVAHTLGGKYGVAHGLANAVLLPHVLRAYGEHATAALAELAKAVGLVDSSLSEADAAEAIISHIEGMNARMQIPRKLECVSDADIPAMAKLADKEANPLYPVPVLWDADKLEALYHAVQ